MLLKKQFLVLKQKFLYRCRASFVLANVNDEFDRFRFHGSKIL